MKVYLTGLVFLMVLLLLPMVFLLTKAKLMEVELVLENLLVRMMVQETLKVQLKFHPLVQLMEMELVLVILLDW